MTATWTTDTAAVCTRALALLDSELSVAASRGEVVATLREHLPRLLPGLRIVLTTQVEDPTIVHCDVIAGALDGEPPVSVQPTAGSALARVRDIGAHRVDLATGRTSGLTALAGAGYRERAVYPVTFGPGVVGSIAVASHDALPDAADDLARIVAAVVSSRSFWFGIPGGPDARSLATQVVQLRQAAHTLERTDPLTRLPNRVAVFESIAEARHDADGSPATFAFIDLDHYKIVNDAHGHAVGDDALVALADRLRAVAARSPITFGRVGGDEFSAVATLTSDELRTELTALAADLQAHPIVVHGVEVHPTFSAGVYPITGHHQGIEEIVSRAEGAAYQAKRDGRDRVILRSPADPGHTASHLEMRQIDVMRAAVRNGRLNIVAQPVRSVDPDVAPPMAAEALVRLRDENGSLLLPDDFVSLAEQYDVVNALDRAVVERVVGLLADAPDRPRVSCNVSPHSLLDPAFVTWAGELIDGAGVGGQLVIELTERLPIGRVPQVRDAMLELRPTGVGFALDDFGEGTTSYGNLRELPVDVLKVDGALSRGALVSPVDRAMLRACVEVATALGVRTIAEGVETSEQFSAVAALGVDAVQGYYFGQPRPWQPGHPLPA